MTVASKKRRKGGGRRRVKRVGKSETTRYHTRKKRDMPLHTLCGESMRTALENTTLSGSLLACIFRETLKGKTLNRTLMNHALGSCELSGSVIDLGSKSGSATYNRFLRFRQPCIVTHTDLHPGGSAVQALNLEEPFPLQDETYDAVLCFNVLEHIFNYDNTAAEACRILKKGGRLIGSTPFLVRYHPDPDDYFRYSPPALERIFTRAGLTCVRMLYLGFGPCAVAAQQLAPLLPSFINVFTYISSIFIDRLLARISPAFRMNYPLAYLFEFRK